MTFLDTGILVGAVLESHPDHAACLLALEDSKRPFTDAHGLAETFATLTGFYKVPTEIAAELILGLRKRTGSTFKIQIYREGDEEESQGSLQSQVGLG